MFLPSHHLASRLTKDKRRAAGNRRRGLRPSAQELEGRSLLTTGISSNLAIAPISDLPVSRTVALDPSLAQDRLSLTPVPDATIASVRPARQDYSPSSRRSSLMNYARSLRDNPSVSSAQALVLLIQKASSLQDPALPIASRVNNMIEDLGDVVGGGVPRLRSLGSRQTPSRFYYAGDRGHRHFGDSGFAPQFRDGSDQVRHFIGGLVTGYRYGDLAGKILSQGREIKELLGIRGEAGFSPADLNLNNVSTRLGAQLRSDPSSVLQLPGQIQQEVETNVSGTVISPGGGQPPASNPSPGPTSPQPTPTPAPQPTPTPAPTSPPTTVAQAQSLVQQIATAAASPDKPPPPQPDNSAEVLFLLDLADNGFYGPPKPPPAFAIANLINGANNGSVPVDVIAQVLYDIAVMFGPLSGLGTDSVGAFYADIASQAGDQAEGPLISDVSEWAIANVTGSLLLGQEAQQFLLGIDGPTLGAIATGGYTGGSELDDLASDITDVLFV